MCGKSNPISVHSILPYLPCSVALILTIATINRTWCAAHTHTHTHTRCHIQIFFNIFGHSLGTKYLIWFSEWMYLRVTAVATAPIATAAVGTITIAIMLRATTAAAAVTTTIASATTSTTRTTQQSYHWVMYVKLYEPNTYVTQSAAISSIHFIILRWWILKCVRDGFSFFFSAACHSHIVLFSSHSILHGIYSFPFEFSAIHRDVCFFHQHIFMWI